MTLAGLDYFSEVWVADFEFRQPDGERPEPICMVARELRSGGMFRLWQDELAAQVEPPIPNSPDVLLVAYYASAELGCYLALGWPPQLRVLDLCAEFKCLTSGLTVPCGRGLLGALTYHGLGGIEVAEKDTMRHLAMRGGPYTDDERRALMDYCESDVDGLAMLLPAMLPAIDLPRAQIRGRYMTAAARIERTGTPIDMPTLVMLRDHWGSIQDRLIAEIDGQYGVYDGRTFKVTQFAQYLSQQGIAWPRLKSGALGLQDATFRTMAKLHPQLAPLRELRYSLSQLRLSDLAVGSDGRNRCLLSAFSSKTGRNQPSSSCFIFGPSVWLRGLIKPERGRALAYVDYNQQEFGIAAALSRDEAMMAAYRSGDPYLAFAKQVGAAPDDATIVSHRSVRERFKVCALAVQYGMGARALATVLNQPEALARQLLRLHRQTYPTFWRWSAAAVDHAMLLGWLQTAFGWRVHVGGNPNPRSLMNFPMQANGAEILRLACCLATERGINVCAPVHDALLIGASTEHIEKAVADCQAAMCEASEVVLDGFPLRTDASIVRHPDRYMDCRGQRMWDTVMNALSDLQLGADADVTPASTPSYARTDADPSCLMSYVLSK